MPVDTFVHSVCTFSNTAAEIQTWVNGAASAGATTLTDVAAPSGAFQLSTDSVGNEWNGQLDECFVTNIALSALEICRICSCGIDGSLCACSGSAYTSNGRHASDCGSCLLPAACDAAPPATPTAAPTQTPTPTVTPTPP
jgi:hypothetical protein